MKSLQAQAVRLLPLFAGLIGLFIADAAAQENSWTRSSSGNWEEPFWSLGILPGTNQSISLTNAGWKAVMIGSSTAQNYPGSLSLKSIRIASPVDSHNTLLLNYAGFQTPLSVNALTVESNATMTMLSSSLFLNGPTGVGMSIGGEFNQSDNSVVSGNQIDIGFNGPGVYNLTSGTLAVGNVWVGGYFDGVFNQDGGSNAVGIVHLDGGQYSLRGGDFSAEVYFNYGRFRQQGGRLNHTLHLYRGTYLLENGMNYGGAVVPVSDGWAGAGGQAMAVQTGGTNFGNLDLGNAGSGTYVLSNGVSLTASVIVGPRGYFEQWNGIQAVNGEIQIREDWVSRDLLGWGSYDLNGGNLSSASLFVGGHYTQNSGTNVVVGDVTVNGTHGALVLNGGELRDNNMTVLASWVGEVSQNGGRHVVTNQLTLFGNTLYGWQGFRLAGGELVVSNIALYPDARFTKAGGTLTHSGLLMLMAGTLVIESGSQFGPLQLESSGTRTNSTLSLSASNACIVRFRDSRAVPWASTARFTIENWLGSATGGGAHQVIFGSDANALNAAQLSQVIFHDPAGRTPGNYTAQILGTGEIVPHTLIPGVTGPIVRLESLPDGTMQLLVQAQAGSHYRIDVSTNLVDWLFWTNQTAMSDQLLLIDLAATNYSSRFYRAAWLP
ncbi:MAG: hypothetical protein ACTHLW_11570 [Verrucomicrobiota bacterium]